MSLTRRGLVAAPVLLPFAARAQPAAPVLKVGVLTDMSSTFRDTSGPTSVACAQQAVQDFAGAGGIRAEVVVADHQNKADVGLSIARRWFDLDGVDLVVDVPNSAIGLAVAGLAREKNKAYANTSAASTDLTGKACNANTLHWVYDTYMLARSTGEATVRAGGDTWFVIGADYVFGQQMLREVSRFVQGAGGRMLGSVFYPFPETTDFSSFLLQAQASKAKVIGFANAGSDAVNCVKQAHEFGITRDGTRLAGLLILVNVVKSLGLETAQGLLLTESFYWDLNPRTRAFLERLRPKTPSNYPNCTHAAVYSATLHYLKAAAELGATAAKADGAAAVARMKAMPTDDDAFGRCTVRADGRFMNPAYLFEVKKPGESTGPWDLYRHLATLDAEAAAPPLGECPIAPGTVR